MLYSDVRSSGAVICHDVLAPVITSARRAARAPEGFAEHLTELEAEVMSA
jgi:hypothetical protein